MAADARRGRLCDEGGAGAGRRGFSSGGDDGVEEDRRKIASGTSQHQR